MNCAIAKIKWYAKKNNQAVKKGTTLIKSQSEKAVELKVPAKVWL